MYNKVYEIMDRVYFEINQLIRPVMYCVCYNNGNDKRMLINYGLFYTKEACEDYIKGLKIDNLTAFPLKARTSSFPDVDFDFLEHELLQAFTSQKEFIKQEMYDLWRKGIADTDIVEATTIRFRISPSTARLMLREMKNNIEKFEM